MDRAGTPAKSQACKGRRRRWSLLAFRSYAVLLTLLFIVVFGEWRKMLLPWIPSMEDVPLDYPWDRTAELFVVPDTAAGLFQFAFGVAALILALSAPLLLLHPQRKAAIRGGRTGKGPGPNTLLRFELAAIGFAGFGLAVGSSIWRAAGGVFENSLEDSVLSLVMFGLVLALGGLLCWLGREGWKPLAWIINGMAAFALVALLAIALPG